MRSPNQVAACLCAFMSAAAAVLVEVPTPENFLRRSMARAALLGKYVYIDGGLITQLEDGELRGRGQNQANTTISIDMSKSWDAKTVVLRSLTNKRAPIKANQVLWPDPTGESFYTFAGQSWLGQGMTDSEVWKFSADGSGGGSWSQVEPANPVVLRSIKQTEHAAVAFTNDTGFAIGGHATGWTEKDRQTTQAIPGIASFNFRTKTFSNTTESPFEDPVIGGQARFVEGFGENGLIFMLGGVTIPVDKYSSVSSSAAVDFSTLRFFDPVTKEVYSQKTTGESPPAPRVNFCNVGFKTPDGGYEIFVFAGGNERDKITYDDAYVLSLPGFVWNKLPVSPAGTRLHHSCVAVGTRQVLVVGGTTGSGMKIPDPAPQGLQIFDMTKWEWSFTYESNDGGVYESGKAIKEWYEKGGLDGVKWSSEKVKKLFVKKTSDSVTDGGSSSGGGRGGDSGSGSVGDGDGLDSAPKKTPIGAIIGGVLGGLAALLVVAIVVFVLLRKKRRQDAAELGGKEMPPTYQDQPRVTGPGGVFEAPGTEGGKYTYAAGTYAGHQVPEVTGGEKYHRHEADGGQNYSEMYSPKDAVAVDVAPVEMYAGSVKNMKR